jgi:hypothetical protein
VNIHLSPDHQRACQNALKLATGVWGANFAELGSVAYSPACMDLMVGSDRFSDRVRDAIGQFSSARETFIIHPDQVATAIDLQDRFAGAPRHMYLHLDDADASCVVAALELLSRAHMGQFHIMIEGRADLSSRIGAALYEIWLYRCSGSLGIMHHSINDEARVAWDLLRVIRGHLAWTRNPEGGFTTEFDRPIRQSSFSTRLAIVSA